MDEGLRQTMGRGLAKDGRWTITTRISSLPPSSFLPREKRGLRTGYEMLRDERPVALPFLEKGVPSLNPRYERVESGVGRLAYLRRVAPKIAVCEELVFVIDDVREVVVHTDIKIEINVRERAITEDRRQGDIDIIPVKRGV